MLKSKGRVLVPLALRRATGALWCAVARLVHVAPEEFARVRIARLVFGVKLRWHFHQPMRTPAERPVHVMNDEARPHGAARDPLPHSPV